MGHHQGLQPKSTSYPRLQRGGHTSSQSQIPSLTSTWIQPTIIKSRLCEKQPTTLRLKRCNVRIQDSLPSVVDVAGPVREIGVPFFFGELCGTVVRRGRCQGEHVNALNIFRFVAKVGSVVYFVFKQLYHNQVSAVPPERTHREGGLTIPVTLLGVKFHGCVVFPSCSKK